MVSRLDYRVPFSETDAMGIVHHSNYPRYFERGRVELLRELGRPYSAMVERGLHFPVLRIDATFRRPARFDDVLMIETRIKEITKTRLIFDYRILAKNGEAVLTEGWSEHCCVNAELKPVAIPKEEYELLTKFSQGSTK